MNFRNIFLFFLLASNLVLFSLAFYFDKVNMTEYFLNCSANPTTCLKQLDNKVIGDFEETGVPGFVYSGASSFVTLVSTILSDLHFLLLVLLVAGSYMAFLFFRPVFSLGFCLLKCAFWPCIKVRRYAVLPTNRQRYVPRFGMRTQSDYKDVDPSAALAQPAREVNIPSTSTEPPATVETPTQQQQGELNMASNPQDMIECNTTRNTLFSGVLREVKLQKQRNFSARDRLYKIRDGEFNLNAKVDSFTWSTSQTSQTVLYNVRVADLVTKHPRYSYLRRLWSLYRFGMRVTIQPTCNSMSSGILLGTLSPHAQDEDGNPGLTINGAKELFYNFGLVPHGFIQAASNDHLVFDIPYVNIDHWMTGGSDTNTLTVNRCLGNIVIMVLTQMSVPASVATTLNYNVFVQMTNIHAKWPQAISLAAQGLIDFKSITINDAKNATIPMNISGDTNSMSLSPVGFDYPSSTKQYDFMRRTIFQKIHHSKGTLDIHRVTFNGSDMAISPYEGVDEMSIKWIMNQEAINGGFTFSSATTSQSLLYQDSVTSSDANIFTLHEMILESGAACEFDSVTYTYYVPKMPYQNGKLWACATVGIIPPATLSAGSYDMTTAPGIMIDLASPNVSHEFTIPMVSTYDLCPSGRFNGYSPAKLPVMNVYSMVPLVVTANTPSSVNVIVTRRYNNFRIVIPTKCGYVAQGDQDDQMACITNRGCIPFKADDLPIRRCDDAISILQYMRLPHNIYHGAFSTGPSQHNGLMVSFSWESVLRSLNFGPWYRIFSGSMRFLISFLETSNAGNIEYMNIAVDKMNQATGSTVLPYGALMPNEAYTGNDTPSGAPTSGQPVTVFVKDSTTVRNLVYGSNTRWNGQMGHHIRVDPGSEREVCVELPIITPRGFLVVDDVGQEANDHYLEGFSFHIFPSLRDVANAVTVTVKITAIAGDDLQGHFLNPAAISAIDRMKDPAQLLHDPTFLPFPVV